MHNLYDTALYDICENQLERNDETNIILYFASTLTVFSMQVARNPSKHPVDKIIQDARLERERLMENEANVKFQAMCDLRADWEKATDRRIQINSVKRKLDDRKRVMQIGLEERRCVDGHSLKIFNLFRRLQVVARNYSYTHIIEEGNCRLHSS